MNFVYQILFIHGWLQLASTALTWTTRDGVRQDMSFSIKITGYHSGVNKFLYGPRDTSGKMRDIIQISSTISCQAETVRLSEWKSQLGKKKDLILNTDHRLSFTEHKTHDTGPIYTSSLGWNKARMSYSREKMLSILLNIFTLSILSFKLFHIASNDLKCWSNSSVTQWLKELLTKAWEI